MNQKSSGNQILNAVSQGLTSETAGLINPGDFGRSDWNG